jgi:L-ascorbate metabolism protein UlaG (beta-lactamase superfamily)
MKEILIGMTSFGLAALAAFSPTPAAAQDLTAFCSATPGPNDVLVFYLGFSGVIIRTPEATIIIDPSDILATSDIDKLKALGIDFLFYTHDHGDHFVLGSAVEIFKATQAYVGAEPGVAAQLRGKIPPSRLRNAAPGQSLKAGKLKLDFVAGQHVGPILLLRVQAGDIRIFHGGDSNYVPLSDFAADVAILPTGRPSPTASPEAAFRMAADIKPQVVVTVHGSDAQNTEFEKRVKAGLKGTTVVIPEPGKMVKLTLRPRP